MKTDQALKDAIQSAAEKFATRRKIQHVHVVAGPGKTDRKINPEWKSLVEAYTAGASEWNDGMKNPSEVVLSLEAVEQIKKSLTYKTDINKALKLLEV